MTNAPFEHPKSTDERALIDGEIQKLLRKQVIEEVANYTNTGYYSNLFTNRKGMVIQNHSILKLNP